MVAAAIALIAITPDGAAAQGTPQVDLPTTRTVPGFTLLDSSLMSIEEIAPLHSTSVTLFSTLRNDDLLPRDIGVELLPWLATTGGSGETVAENYRQLYRPDVLGVMRQYLAVSLAISQDASDAPTDESLSHVAVGVRTFLLGGRPNSELARLMGEYDARSAELDAAVAAQADDLAAEQRVTDLFVLTRELLRQLNQADKSRVGFMLDTGIAAALGVPENVLADSHVVRRSWWITPIYRFDGIPVSVSGVVRYTQEPDTDVEMLDGGFRVSARRGGIHYSMEAVGRRRWAEVRPADADYLNGRLVGGVSYAFNRSTQMIFTMGRNFKEDFSSGGTLVASFGLNIGLGEIPLGLPAQ